MVIWDLGHWVSIDMEDYFYCCEFLLYVPFILKSKISVIPSKKKKVGRTRLKETIENKINLSLSWWRLNFFSFFGFIYWNFYYNIRLETKKMWETSKKYILLSIFRNTTSKHLKIFSRAFFKMQQNTWKYFVF